MNNLEDKITYGICIDGHLTSIWSEKYPSKSEINFSTTPQSESIEIVERVETYEVVAKIK